MPKKRLYKYLFNLKSLLALLLIIFLLSGIIRTFILQSYKIGKDVYFKEIKAGDKIIINKIKTGSRLPITLLSLPFFPDIYSSAILLPYKHLFAVKPELFDLVLFNNPQDTLLPIDKRNLMISRIVGLPGDTIEIRNNILFINNKVVEDSSLNTYYNFRVVADTLNLTDSIIQSLSILNIDTISDMGIYQIIMLQKSVHQIKKYGDIKFIKKLSIPAKNNHRLFFPDDEIHLWNECNFGPLVIPEKDAVITINRNNFEIYKHILINDEKCIISWVGDKCIINKNKGTYKFKMNYYFVLDDIRNLPNDSRKWGFLPESHLIGTYWWTWSH
ncbi:MAG: hypothetical protein Kow0068_09980 [Marinilabiliales bacterium]